MLIVPSAELHLAYVISFIRSTSDSQIIIAASITGNIYVLNQNLVILHKYSLGFDIDDLTVSPDSQMIAVTNRKSQLTVMKLDGEIIFQETLHISNQNETEYKCVFSIDGTKLWDMYENLGLEEIDNSIILRYRETKNWQIQKQIFVPNECPSSYSYLTVHSQCEMINICRTDGHCSYWNYWMWSSDQDLTLEKLSILDDYNTPVFHPQELEFLAYCDKKAELSRYSFPDCKLLGSMTLDIEGNDYLSFYQCYLSQNRAIVMTENRRLFMIDTNQMKVIDEIILQGYEPIQEKDYSYNHIRFFERVGVDTVITLHGKYSDEQTTLLMWKV